MTKSRKGQKQEVEVFDDRYEFGEGKVPPNAIELESSVLGSVLIDNEVLNDLVQFLDYTHFYKSANGTIYKAMMNLEGRREPIDANTLKEELKRMNKLSEVGGVEYIIELANSAVTSANAEHYGRIIFDRYILRNLISISSKVVEKCFDPTVNPYGLLDEAERKILDISEALAKKKVVAVKDEIVKLFDNLADLKGRDKKGVSGISTGYELLDAKTSGFQKSELIIIAGRPSHGKTALAINIARNAAVVGGKSVAIFSLEMTTRELLIRMLSGESRVDNLKLKTGRASEAEWNRVASNFHKLKTNIYIDDTSELSVLELRAKARRIKQEFGIDMIIVDYLQLIRGLTTHERRDLEVAYVSRSLKALAKELDIPVVACAQLNRGIEQRGKEKRPQLADLRESGAIEQDADVVIFVHRPFLMQKNDQNDPKYEENRLKCEVTIGKQRNGPAGETFELIFFPEFTKFENKTKKPDIAFPESQVYDEETPF